ncbi:hypothetical protein QAD02_017000 [Eretmocerus hayati]|uniref:Uncharacterized protein n=1 Tax=Eretmocerus hayati TaxID=131215 RepID=A0ACC2PDP3_9HYME|nr:hypothetical protein QAD02_017000 [Eretmocerus hayati]
MVKSSTVELLQRKQLENFPGRLSSTGLQYCKNANLRDELVVISEVSTAVYAGIGTMAGGQIGLKGLDHDGAAGQPLPLLRLFDNQSRLRFYIFLIQQQRRLTS